MSDEDAIEQHYMSGQNVKFHVENVQFCAQQKKRRRLQAESAKTDLLLKPQLQVPRVPHKVTQWLGQYEKDLMRYKVLLLWGESQTGKSQFVHWLIPGILEINCQGKMTCPDLHEYDEGDGVRAIFFDEASLELILSNRKVFQCINKPVKLGQTVTGKFSYDVYTYKCMMVVANNTFETDYCKLSPDDKNWIDDNVMHVQIKKGDLFDPVPQDRTAR